MGYRNGLRTGQVSTAEGVLDYSAPQLRDRPEPFVSAIRLTNDLRSHGLGDPLLMASDGAPGIVKAIENDFPRPARQRCLAHRTRNLAGLGAGRSMARVQGVRARLLPGAVAGDRSRPGGLRKSLPSFVVFFMILAAANGSGFVPARTINGLSTASRWRHIVGSPLWASGQVSRKS